MKNRKGIILAGGSGTRLYPLTFAISKQITTNRDNKMFKELLGDGSKWGMKFSYATQEKPNGIAEAFIIAEEYIGEDNVALILGDNMFYGGGFKEILEKVNARESESTIFGYEVKAPNRYGVIEIDENGNAISIEEKPLQPKSNYAVPGLYFYTNDVIDIAKSLKPSLRGELEITSINEEYMKRKKLKVEKLGREIAWFDTGTYDALLETASFVQTIEKRQGLQICCPEEIAFENGWINKKQLEDISQDLMKTDYGKYLINLSKDTEV